MDLSVDVYLVRHAQSHNNAKPESERVEDPGLTELGRAQAECLARWFRRHPVDTLLTSPFRRTLETSAALVQAGLPTPEIWVELHEYGGCYAGYTYDTMEGRPGMSHGEIASEFPGYAIPNAIDEQGWWKSRPYESHDAAIARARSVLDRLRRSIHNEPRTIVCVMHADFKQILLGLVAPRDLEVPYNTSVSRIRLTASSTQLLDYNAADHLPDDYLTK